MRVKIAGCAADTPCDYAAPTENAPRMLYPQPGSPLPEPEDLTPQVRLLSTTAALSVNGCLINVVVGGALSAVLWFKVDHSSLMWWLGLVLGVQAGRCAAARWLLARDLVRREPELAFRVLLVGAGLTGLAWGLALPLLGGQLSSGWQLLLLTVIGGLASGALSTLGNSVALFAAFLHCAVLPSAVWMTVLGGEIGRVVGPLALVYALNLTFLGRGAARRARRLAELAYENARLARDLASEKTALDEANQDLRRALDRQVAVEKELRRHRDSLADLVAERTGDLVAAKERAEAANRAKSSFLANISHELRTPMHAVLSFAAIGLSRNDPATAPGRYFQRIHRSGQRLLALLDDLLDLSRLEAGREALDSTDVSLRDIVEHSLAEVESLLAEKDLRIVRNDADADLVVHGEATRLVQVLTNLLGNAIKFSPAGAEIRVRLEAADHRGAAGARITVQDQGVGIPDDELEAVFDKFVQSSKTRTGAGGTGLGLPICRELVGRHGGHVWAEPAVEGACLRVWLPIAAQVADTAA